MDEKQVSEKEPLIVVLERIADSMDIIVDLLRPRIIFKTLNQNSHEELKKALENHDPSQDIFKFEEPGGGE